MPKPAGMMAALLTVMSEVAHIQSMGLEPRKNVGPKGLPVKSPTTSFITRPSMSDRACPINFLYICSLASRHTIRRSLFPCCHAVPPVIYFRARRLNLYNVNSCLYPKNQTPDACYDTILNSSCSSCAWTETTHLALFAVPPLWVGGGSWC